MAKVMNSQQLAYRHYISLHCIIYVHNMYAMFLSVQRSIVKVTLWGKVTSVTNIDDEIGYVIFEKNIFMKKKNFKSKFLIQKEVGPEH